MNYNVFVREIENLSRIYSIKNIGKSWFNRDIFAVEKIVKEKADMAIIVAGVHAREHITTDLVVEFLKRRVFDEIEDFNVACVPMLNPDGVELSSGGLITAPMKFWETLIAANGGNLNFSIWKANGVGVDLNNNFDAGFGEHVSNFKPSPQGFAGACYESEVETRALVNFTLEKRPFITLSYHSKGEEIYFNYFQEEENLKRDSVIAERFKQDTGYTIKNPESVSSGGYKDWCVKRLKIPALTIEVGSDDLEHPILKEHLKEIYFSNKQVASGLQFAYNVIKGDICLNRDL